LSNFIARDNDRFEKWFNEYWDSFDFKVPNVTLKRFVKNFAVDTWNEALIVDYSKRKKDGKV